MRLTLKAVNAALAEQGEDVRLAKADGYFYFEAGEAANWIDRTVTAKTLSSLTLEQWLDEFKKLKKLNADMLAGKSKVSGDGASAPEKPARKSKKSST